MNLLDHETAHPPGGQRPKLPVLFHLLDLSRPRSAPLAAEAPAERIPEPSPVELPLASIAVEPLPLAPPSEPDAPTTSVDCAPQAETEVLSAVDSVLAADVMAEAKVAAPPSPRSPSERRRAKAPASEEWVATHGKYIAIVFVVALAATIYFARTNRRTRPVASSDPAPFTMEQGESAASSAPGPGAAKSTTTVVADSSVAAGTNPASPARLIETTSASAPQTELFPPTTPSVAATRENNPAAESAGNAATAGPSLATRGVAPDATSNPAAQLTAESTAAVPPPAATAAVPAPPALEPSYPTTGYPTMGLPAANYPTTNLPPPPTYPVTSQPAYAPPLGAQMSYGPQMQPPPTVQPSPVPPAAAPIDTRSAFVPPTTTWTQPNWQSPPPPAQQPAYSPSYNPAPGTRYERSGSGLY